MKRPTPDEDHTGAVLQGRDHNRGLTWARGRERVDSGPHRTEALETATATGGRATLATYE